MVEFNADQGMLLSPALDRQIRLVIRQYLHQNWHLIESELRGEERRPSRFRTRFAVLDEELAAPTSSFEPTTALATLVIWDADAAKYRRAGRQLTVSNHSEYTSHAVDTFGKLEAIDGHLCFFGDCGPMASREFPEE